MTELVEKVALNHARHNVYLLQMSMGRLCDALRSIARSAENPIEIATAALLFKGDKDPAAIEAMRDEVEREGYDRAISEVVTFLTGADCETNEDWGPHFARRIARGEHRSKQ